MKRVWVGSLVVAGVAALLSLMWLTGAYDTRGMIFVGSPEVYTRERLVNDRYDQDFWLHSQLKRLDNSTALLTSVVRNKVNVGVNVDIGGGDAAGAGGAGTVGADTGGDVTVEMPFDQEFLIRASVRDAIRQLILENLLDDRHDLTGNSVYGLKFDMSVIAGDRTYASAFIKASIKARQLFSEEGPGSGTGGGRGPANNSDTDQEAPRHVRQYFAGTVTNIEEQERNPLHTSYTLYNLWLADVGARLNTYVGQIYDTIDTSSDGVAVGSCGVGARVEWERRVLQAINDVLGINSSAFGPSLQGLRAIKLPIPWRNHISVLVSEFRDGDCRSIPVFSTEPIWDPIYLVEGDPPGDGFIFVDNVDETTAAYASTKGYSREELDRDPGIYQELLPRYKQIAALADYVKNQTEGGAMIANVLPGSGRPAPIIVVPSGFFNFIESVIRTNSYTYALFPKTEVFGVLAEQSSDINAALSAAAGETGRGGGTISSLSSERGFQATPRTVGFNEATETGAVQFGWVIGGHGRMQSTQKSGLALVSVPAWTNELSVHVDTGWVRSSGALAVTGSYDFTVPIPPDYEAFDAFVGGSRVRHEPRISNDLLAKWQVLEACDDVSIIIPGFRLWRSTVVTLGSQAATRITVLPNMRGIIARFDDLFAENVPRASESVKLRVWTSEGVDTAASTFSITPPSPARADCAASGDDDAGEVATTARTADGSGRNEADSR